MNDIRASEEAGEVEPFLPGAQHPPYPPEVGKVLSYLANMIDNSIALRGVGRGVRGFAATFLGVSATETVANTTELPAMAFQMTALAFAEDLESHPPLAIIGEDQEEPPRWESLDLGELKLSVPYQLAAAFPSGNLAECPLVVLFDEEYGEEKFKISVYSRTVDSSEARKYLDDLLKRGKNRTNPFKGRILETITHPKFGLSFRVVGPSETIREEVVLPGFIWDELDRNVHGFLAGLETLKRAGLARNRGILLEGPPGTGKTAICRALAGEMKGATVVFCDAAAVEHSVSELYRQMVDLSPALVVMEDIDLIIGHRHQGASSSLNNFLLALDGAITSHEAVVTIATTNDVNAIDPAAKRSARFDAIVTVPLPDQAGRGAILERYLAHVPNDVDIQLVARATEGASGADLRELVSSAVITAAEDNRQGGDWLVTSNELLRLAKEKQEPGRVGIYL